MESTLLISYAFSLLAQRGQILDIIFTDDQEEQDRRRELRQKKGDMNGELN